jgi:capsular polysaccharide biosynthesis protein
MKPVAAVASAWLLVLTPVCQALTPDGARDVRQMGLIISQLGTLYACADRAIRSRSEDLTYLEARINADADAYRVPVEERSAALRWGRAADFAEFGNADEYCHWLDRHLNERYPRDEWRSQRRNASRR